MTEDTEGRTMEHVIQIDEGLLWDHLGEMFRGIVEDASINVRSKEQAFGAKRIQSPKAPE